eukprot:GHVH01004449.1.p1 GENE.GHVH01004449.1~~GHVH01004449.1.p1  ORF type:complete len:412 (+),score=41.16 GHVH01004449.1:893-2128(+)
MCLLISPDKQTHLHSSNNVMGLTDLLTAGVKLGGQVLLEGISSYVPSGQAMGHDSTSQHVRELAAELEKNYQLAARDFQQSGASRPPNRRIALCIGCNYPHDRKHTLKACVNDASRWAELLSRNYDFQVVLMTDDSLRNNNWNDPLIPTMDNVLRTLKSLIGQMQRGDCLFIAFSGHGTRVKDVDGDDGDGFDECLVLPDKRKSCALITDDILYREAICHVPEGCKLTAVFDCCRSGGALDLDWELHTARDDRTGMAKIGTWGRDNQTNPHPCLGEVTLISGCASSQTSLEVQGGGALTTEMVRILSRQPYHWTYAAFISEVIKRVYNNPVVQRVKNPQCPTLSSSIPFDVNQRMFGPDQLSGIQLPEKQNGGGRHRDYHNNENHHHSTSASSQPACDVPKYMMNLIGNNR